MGESEYVVVIDVSGQKIIGRVNPAHLLAWTDGVTHNIAIFEPVRLVEQPVPVNGGIRMEVHTYPIDAMDPGVPMIVIRPASFYKPTGHKLKALHETRWTELRAAASGLSLPGPTGTPREV